MVPCLVKPTRCFACPALPTRVTLAMSWSGLHTGTLYSACPFPYTSHHLSPLSLSPCLACPGSLATQIFYPRESRLHGPDYNMPNIPVFPFPFSLRASRLPLAHPPWSSYLGSLGTYACPFRSCCPTVLSHPPSPLTSRLPHRSFPALLPSPAWISPSLAFFPS